MKSFRQLSTLARSSSAIAVAVCLMVPGVALAQAQADAVQQATADAPAGDSTDQDIVITGLRASLERSMEIKRDSAGVVDAISAEDIGKFPDTNLAESLQRITGVSINRTNGEGSQVTVRGFGPDFNLVTLNGRTLATSIVSVVGGDENADGAQGTSRSFDFSNLASEGVKTLEVYKTGRAAIPSGGIGATINVVTRRPLDGAGGLDRQHRRQGGLRHQRERLPRLRLQGHARGIRRAQLDRSVGTVRRLAVRQLPEAQLSPSISATSNDWNIIPYSTFLSGGFARSGGACPTSTPTPTCTVVNNAPTNANQLVAIPNDSRYHYAEGTRERINGQAVVQFRPTDTLTLTADGLFRAEQAAGGPLGSVQLVQPAVRRRHVRRQSDRRDGDLPP